MRAVSSEMPAATLQRVRRPIRRSQKPVDPGVRAVYGHPFADVGPKRTLPPEFPDLKTQKSERKGFGLMRFSNSSFVELEGHGDLEKARTMLAKMNLEPVPTPSGKARVSIGSMNYRFFGGLFNPNEVWVAIQARPKGGGPVGLAYIYTITDSAIMKKIGSGWGIPYERGAMQITDSGYAPDAVRVHDQTGHAFATMLMSNRSSMWARARNREVDFPSYSPSGKTMEVHIEGRAVTRPFDPDQDTADFGKKTEVARLCNELDFDPRNWVSQRSASGVIRAR